MCNIQNNILNTLGPRKLSVSRERERERGGGNTVFICSCDLMLATSAPRKVRPQWWHRRAAHTTGGHGVLSALASLEPPLVSLLHETKKNTSQNSKHRRLSNGASDAKKSADLSNTCEIYLPSGRSCLLANIRMMASFISLSLIIRWSSCLASSILSLSAQSTTNIRPCVPV